MRITHDQSSRSLLQHVWATSRPWRRRVAEGVRSVKGTESAIRRVPELMSEIRSERPAQNSNQAARSPRWDERQSTTHHLRTPPHGSHHVREMRNFSIRPAPVQRVPWSARWQCVHVTATSMRAEPPSLRSTPLAAPRHDHRGGSLHLPFRSAS